MTKRLPPDQVDRQRAVVELEANLVVEAGAGSGKTTLLATRITSLLKRNRDDAERIAAVTFTKKAAGELRERVQLTLEKDGLEGGLADRVFIGTIHSFCARLLRERPVDAGLDPKFRELDDDESDALRDAWWEAWVERLHVAGDPALRELLELLVPMEALKEAFKSFVQFADVDLSAPAVAAPDIAPLATQLDEFLHRGFALMPDREPPGGWDKVQEALQRLWHQKQSKDWTTTGKFLESIATVPSPADAAKAITQIRWVRNPDQAKEEKKAAKEFATDFIGWRTGPVEAAVVQWREHRYAPIAQLLERATDEFRRYRLCIGRLSFDDLLEYARKLLRENDDARRTLGERWRYLLVDEFQDTDPIQAEVIFLLGSSPADDPSRGAPWTQVRLRPGALFVVGDPKQSIYRFRRADIEIYEQAKKSIGAQGSQLRLTANFRSVKGIETFVNTHFADDKVFPAKASPMQAAFSPMNVMPAREGALVREQPLARYVIKGGAHTSKRVVMEQDSQRVASWVAGEIADGRLAARDVMILAQKKEGLAWHARELAARNIPVSVSGANVALEAEMHELQLVLQLFADPASSVLVAAALEGMFIGASPADLWAARDAGVVFSLVEESLVGAADARVARVVAGLRQLREWLARSHTDAPDVFLSHLLDETGLLAHTAASDLGDVRAGLLLRLVDDVRIAALEPEQAAAGALSVLERMLTADMPDAPLMPGRTDAVRVMNLHKAKGLEAPVVILAGPSEIYKRGPTVAVRREGVRPKGGVLISVSYGNSETIVAQPPGWKTMCDTETQFADAEGNRRRYVAATRAGAQLVISEFVKELKAGPSRTDDREWSRFSPTLDEMKVEASAFAPSEAGGRPRLERSAGSIAQEIAQVESTRAEAGAQSWRRRTVSQSARAEMIERKELEFTGAEGAGRGAAWGRAVHAMLESAGRDPGTSIAATALRIAGEEGIAEDSGALAATIETFLQGEAWRELAAAPERRFEWPVAGWSESEGRPSYIEGVIDAAYRTPDGWQILDWKTDSAEGESWAEREAVYERQVALYADLLSRAVGERATARLVRVARVEPAS